MDSGSGFPVDSVGETERRGMAGKLSSEEKAKRVRCIVLDVDGVLTEGQITLDEGGKEWKSFDVKDGYGIVLARSAGLKVAFLSGRRSGVVSRRGAELSVDRIYQGAGEKGSVMDRLFEEERLSADEVAYIGDDLPDLPAMRKAGLACAVGDAVAEVRESADWISRRPGGRGAVRELVEFVLRSQGLWERAVAQFGS
jgi:3-deoxy-D-manno-octulosonate 8-phosphate phosphatase (KDO 8-P phosphatase)